MLHLTWLLAFLAADDDLAAKLREANAQVLPADPERGRRLAQDARARLMAANDRETDAWRKIQTRADWERYRDRRIEALRLSLGTFPAPPSDLKVRITRALEGEGFRIENLVFESRPGLVVTANLYLPAKPAASMPGILLCHSHHSPKTQGELQDMGMLWARVGCMVLVMDQLGHGERRQHPYLDARSYPGQFRPTRQDYYFRYNVGIQLHLIGDSLVGWMAWDLMRGVDLLLSRGADKERIALLGAVAGGGDPCAVAAALDPRITAAVPFNFGGPQPETVHPLPQDAEKAFNYAGGGSWESTRNLRLSARDGFLPWVVVGSLAPRGLVYAHEFAWDRERDPVWRRLEKIYGFTGAGDRLASANGRGKLSGQAPESTHCNNIGAAHRQAGIYAAFERWFKIPPPREEPQERRPAEELLCLTGNLKVHPVHGVATEIAHVRASAARKRLEGLPPEARRERLRADWARLLGEIEPRGEPKPAAPGREQLGEAVLERVALEVEPGIDIPLLLLAPAGKSGERRPVVIGLAQEGKEAFLKNRAETIAALLRGGATVCLPDLRGTGETAGDKSPGRSSGRTSLSSTELMLGQTLVGSRLRDLRSVIRHLRTRPELSGRVALWGDSFAPVNHTEARLEVPLDATTFPHIAEPLGGLLALLGGLYEDAVLAVYVQGGLAGFDAVLRSRFVYVPHDVIVPGASAAGDLELVAAALEPRPVRQEGMVDGLNRRLRDVVPPAGAEVARWLLAQIGR